MNWLSTSVSNNPKYAALSIIILIVIVVVLLIFIIWKCVWPAKAGFGSNNLHTGGNNGIWQMGGASASGAESGVDVGKNLAIYQAKSWNPEYNKLVRNGQAGTLSMVKNGLCGFSSDAVNEAHVVNAVGAGNISYDTDADPINSNFAGV